MKGVVFTEFLELVESLYGMEVSDRIQRKGLPFDCGFTSVETYDHRVLLSLIEELSTETGVPVRELVLAFGKHLFHRFRALYPESVKGVADTISLLRKAETEIHDEVVKLDPDAETPRFQFSISPEGDFRVQYLSGRPFADLAEGIIESSIEHFGDDLILERIDLEGPPGTHALFCLKSRTTLP